MTLASFLAIQSAATPEMPPVRRLPRAKASITAMSAAAFMSGTRLGWAAAKVEPITIVINQSPWFDSFRKTVELYEKETGNKVELDVNPFAGSLEKQRNSVRASKAAASVRVG